MSGDDDMWAAMGLPTGFGKKTTKKKVDITARLESTKRATAKVDEVRTVFIKVYYLTREDIILNQFLLQPPSVSNDLDDEGENAASSSRSQAPLVPDARQAPSASASSSSHILPSTRPRSPYDHPDGIDSDNDDDDDEDEEASDSDTDNNRTETFPISHEVTFKDHTKVVSALALDPSGARIASGSHDYECKLWDFGGMTASHKPFKSWEPAGSYYVCLFTLVLLLSDPEVKWETDDWCARMFRSMR